jgi:DNA-binding response OmpR family regulator
MRAMLSTPLPAAARAPAPAITTRLLSLWSDDSNAALDWQAQLLPEGLSVQASEGPRCDADAHVLFVHGALSLQLGRLREQRQAAPQLPLLVACRALRELDQVLALEMGADEVVDTALSAPVVAARLRALWRRAAPGAGAAPAAPRELSFGALHLMAPQRCVLLGEQRLPLSEGEFEVLWLLACHAGSAVSRSEILRRVRGLQDHPTDRSIDSRVYRIRAKLGDPNEASRRIRTVRNFGYAFSPRDW